jgi:2-polyprenyl-3-methyl-5-hydroxy-6-metoxy-1,4-benzoquinol methylase
MKPFPKENLYGHTKKLKFFICRIEKYLKETKKDISLLDYGCGNGQAVSQYLIMENVNYYGVDLHEPSIDFANKYFSKSNASFYTSIPTNIKFDILLYSDILEHLHDPAIILESHKDMLSENGIILGSIPNGYGPFEMENRIFRITRLDKFYNSIIRLKSKMKNKTAHSDIPYNLESGHVQFFTKTKFFKLLEDQGYKIIVFKNGSFAGANYSEKLTFKSELIAKINAKIADYLPGWAVSTWYFEARKVQ